MSTKDAAAREVKRLRAAAGVQPSDAAAAETAYRVALADLIAFETGSAPDWAPTAATEAGAPEETEGSEEVELADAAEDESAEIVTDEA